MQDVDPGEMTLITLRQIAELLDLPYTSVQTLHKQGEFGPRARLIGGRWRVPKVDVVKWFNGEKVE